MREKIIELLEPLESGAINEEDDKFIKGKFADKIISTLIEGLLEERNMKDEWRNGNENEIIGWNAYRSEVINLLRGN